MERTPLLEIEGLKKYYPIEAGISKKKETGIISIRTWVGRARRRIMRNGAIL